jgi:hypothetical protein
MQSSFIVPESNSGQIASTFFHGKTLQQKVDKLAAVVNSRRGNGVSIGAYGELPGQN